METAVTTQGTLNYNDKEVLAVMKQTIAADANQAEFKLFVEFCKGTGLNPFKREIWFIKPGGRVQMMTSAAGFFTIANAQPEYDGMDQGFIDPQGNRVPLEYPKNDFIGAWCDVYRKDRKLPQKAVAMMAEYDKKQSNWKSMPRVMIMKCAESLALRKAFPQQLNGMYTQEEMPTEYAKPPEVITPKEPELIEPDKEQWYYFGQGTTTAQTEFLEQQRCIEYKIYEMDIKTGQEVEIRNLWKAPKNLGPKLANHETDQPDGPIEIGIGEGNA